MIGHAALRQLLVPGNRHDGPARVGRAAGRTAGLRFALGGTTDALEDLARDLAVPASGAALRGSLWLIGPDAVIRAELLPPYDVAALTATYLRTRMRR
jgi:hypothetical protein